MSDEPRMNSSGGRGARIAGTAALIGAGILAGLAATRPSPPVFDRDGFTRALEARLGEATAGLHIRVGTLAELPRLAVAVATDARTVHDLTQDELAFRPHAGETIAIGQIPKGSGKPPVWLRVAPSGAAVPSFELGGPRLRVVGESLIASEVMLVVPRERAKDLDGLIAVTWVVDLGALSAELASAGAQAELATDGGRLTFGAPRAPAAAVRHPVPVELRRASGSAAANQPRVAASVLVAERSDLRPWLGSAAGLLVLLGLGALASRRRRSAVDETPASLRNPASWPSQSAPELTTTALSGPRSSPSIGWPSRQTLEGGGISQAAIGRVGRYDLLRKIGVGGMAEVYLARATGEAGFAKLVALKVLLPDFASQPQVVEHFLDEARLAAQLYHSNVVQTVDLGRTGDHYFMAMEYVDGTDLLRLIGISQARQEPVPVQVALGILRGVCAGLQAAHEASQPDGQPLGLVHRDVKSANVFVSRSGVVKVGDFGIAKAHHAGWVRRTENGLVKGTPGYMSPEQRLGHAIDGRADLYGVGAIAYELFTGRPVNLDLAFLAAKGREGWPHLDPIASVRPDVPRELEAIVMRALAFDREDRYPSCAALEQALEAVAVAHPPIAGDKAVARWIDDLLTGEAHLAEVTPSASLASIR